MQIKSLYIHNYKSFYDTTIEFDKFNIIVAPNNAGKTNLIDVLEFINIALEYDIERAIKDKGGIDSIKNYKNDEEKIVIKICYYTDGNKHFIRQHALNFLLTTGKASLKIKFIITKHDIQTTFSLDGYTKLIELTEKQFLNLNYVKQVINDTNKINFYLLSTTKQSLFDKKEKYKTITNNDFIIKKSQPILWNFNIFFNERDRKLLKFISEGLTTELYYFHPEIIKQKSHLEAEEELQRSGNNLGKNLAYIKNYDKKNSTNNFEKISNSLIGTVEEIDEVDVTPIAGQYILTFKEQKKDININIISDGTINLVATITALNQPEDSSFMLAFEEPERHLHLKAVNYLLDEFRNHDKQILITTHSTEILNSAKIEELIFMYRDSYGDTKTIRADKIKGLKDKLKRLGSKKDLSISELIDENILGDLEDYE